MAEPVRVLVVDDSSFFRKRISRYLEESPDINVVGEAADGAEAVQLNRALSPDVITMDVAMPVLDGISAVRRIMAEHPTRIIMISAMTREGAQATLDALDAGALDFLTKMADGHDPATSFGALLRTRVLEIARRRKLGPAESPAPVVRSRLRAHERVDLVMIGASTGGPVAVQDVLSQLPAKCPVPVLVAVHMPKTFTGTFAERLDALCAVRVREASDGDLLRPGEVLVAPGGKQTEVVNRRGVLQVSVSEGGEHLYKPCIDLTFGSAAEHVDGPVLAIVLTGMGHDGAKGAQLLKRKGAQVWAQDEASSVVYGMPAAIARSGLADRILPLTSIARELREVG